MPPAPDSSAEPRKPRGPEPLRRKRVQPAPSSTGRRRRIVHALLGFAVAVVLIDALVGEKGFMERMRARREYSQVAARLEAVRQQNAQLRQTIIRLREDPSAVEAIAREELGMVKPGELVFIIRDVKPAAAGTPRADAAVER